MQVYEFTEDNIDEFASYLGADITDDLNRNFFRGYGAKDDNDKAIGALVYEVLGSDNDDEDIRGALRLLKAENDEAYASLLQIYKDEGIDNDEITESYYQFTDEEPADNCSKQGFSKEEREGDILDLSLNDALNLDFVKKIPKTPDYISGLDGLSMVQYRTAIRDCLFEGQKGLLEDLGYLNMNWFDIEVSSCTITDGEVKGLFLVRVTPSGIITPELFYAQGADFKKNLLLMLTYSLKKAEKKYPRDSRILINCSRSATEALAKKLLPGIKGPKTFFGNRSEE